MKKIIIGLVFFAFIWGCSGSIPVSTSPAKITPPKTDTIPYNPMATIYLKMGIYIPDSFVLWGTTTKAVNASSHSVYIQIDTLINDTLLFGKNPLLIWGSTHYDTSITVNKGMRMKLFWYKETNPYAPLPIHTDSLKVTKDTTFYFNIQAK